MRYHISSMQGRVVRELIRKIRSDNLLGKKLKDGTFRKKIQETEPFYKVPDGFESDRNKKRQILYGIS